MSLLLTPQRQKRVTEAAACPRAVTGLLEEDLTVIFTSMAAVIRPMQAVLFFIESKNH